MKNEKPSLLILNQYFPPDQSATALLLGQLVMDLRPFFSITLICGTPTYNPDAQAMQMKDVGIKRIPLFPASRRSLMFRVLNYLIYFFGAAFTILSTKKLNIVMAWTDPPTIGLLGAWISKWKRVPFVFVSQDVYPEIAQAVGRMNHFLPQAILHWSSKVILREASSVVCVGQDMKRRLIKKGCSISKLHWISNWQDTNLLRPVAGDAFRLQYGIPGSAFLVMHSGNMGWSQDFESLLQAAYELRSEKEIHFALVGDGSRKEELVKIARKRNLENVHFIPYQPQSSLAASLSAADLHYVSLKEELVGLIVPSKIYGIMAVERPILLNVPQSSDAYKSVWDAGCGVLSSEKSLVEDIQSWKERRSELIEMGRDGRQWLEKNASREVCTKKYRELLLQVLSIN